MASPNVASLTADAVVELGGQVFGASVLNWDLAKYGIELRTNVKMKQALTKLTSQGNPEIYSASDSNVSSNGPKFLNRVLEVVMTKWDYDFDPEQFRNTFLANPAAQNGNFVELCVGQLAKEYISKLNLGVVYAGDTGGSGIATIADGFKTIIADEITASAITPVAVSTMTSSNAVTEIEKVTDAATPYMKENGFIVLCSWATLEKYRTHYRSLNGFAFNPDANGQYKIDGKNAQLIAWPAMGTSSRVIATPANNLVVGTDTETITVAASMRRNIIESRPMMAIGMQIKDLEQLVVNDKA